MTLIRHRLVLPFAAVGVLAFAAAGCGGDDGKDTASTAGVTQTATVTQTDSTPLTKTPEGSYRRGQKEVAVKAAPAKLAAPGVGTDFTVTKVVDPLDGGIDEPRAGNKFVGIFIKGSRDITKNFSPTDSNATAVLDTTKGPITAVRLISDGDCAGGFFPGALLGVTKPKANFEGCIGFEVPKAATPTAITINLTSAGQTKRATFKLPAAG